MTLGSRTKFQKSKKKLNYVLYGELRFVTVNSA